MTVDQYSPAAYGICRGEHCRKPILWADTGRALMPLDVDPSPDGNVEIVGTTSFGRPKVVVHHQPPLGAGELHMPHHATCPDVKDFRA